MNKYWFKTALFTLSLGAFTACSNDDGAPETPEMPETTVGAYIMNTGNWGQNNGTIQWYDDATGQLSADLFAASNGKEIGDVQDICVYGSKIYISCSTSSKIEIVNQKDFKIVKTLTPKDAANKPIQPRYLTATSGKVFFTAYDGTVSQLDTLTMEITGKIQVGAYPEALTHANGKLYVNISNYAKGTEVAVVDIATFTKTKTLPVLLNPYDECMTAADGNVYFVSNGNYPKPEMPEADRIYQTLQRIDPQTDKVTELCHATRIANRGDKMYIIYAEYHLKDTHKIYVYDLKTGQSSKEIIDIKTLSNPGSIDVDPTSGDIYISNTPYSAKSDLYIYDANGTFKKKIETGYNTLGVTFLTKKGIS